MDIRIVASLIRNRWRWIVLFGLVGVVVSMTLTALSRPIYSATSKDYVSIQAAADTTDLTQGAAFTQQVVKSYATVATTPIVLDYVKSRLNLKEATSALAQAVTTSAPLDEVVLEITVRDPSPSRAAAIANAISSRLKVVVADLTPGSRNSSAVIRLTQVQAAVPAQTPDTPRPLFNLAVGILIGLFLGLIAAAVRNSLDNKLRGALDIERVTDLPILGGILFNPESTSQPLIDLSSSGSSYSEAYRTMRTNLQYLEFGEGRRSICLTSSVESEGKTTTSANLALALAQSGQSVLLVDADLRRPRVAAIFGIDGGIGLTSVLSGTANISNSVQKWGETTLEILPAGPVPPNPSELLQSARMSELIADLSARYDTVLYDAPPLLPVSDAAILAKATDGALVCAAVGRVRRNLLKASLSNLSRVEARGLGVVMTFLPRRSSGAYAYSGYKYSYDSAN